MKSEPERLPPELGDDRLMDEAETAAYIGTAPGTLTVWRCTGRYNLPFLKIGRLVRYRKSAVDQWLERRTRCQTDNAA